MIPFVTRMEPGVGCSRMGLRLIGRPIVAKGQKKSNREAKKPKADKNKKKADAAPASPFADSSKGKAMPGKSGKK